MPKQSIDFTLRELREIILGLRMSGLSFVEDGAISEIQAMIKSLPSAEDLEKHYSNPESLKQLQKDVGGIMRLIEIYGKRDGEYKVRYKSRTGLPPRYKVMEWREPMQQAAKNNNKIISTVNKVVKGLKKLGLNEEAEIVKEAGIRDMWNAGKEAYIYRTIMSEMLEVTKQFGKAYDKTNGLIAKIQNPEFKDKLAQVSDRFGYAQQIVANLAQFMNGSQELADVGGGAGGTGEKAEIGKPVTFTDNKQYVVQELPPDGSKILFINVGGTKQKVITDTLSNVKGFEPLEESHKAKEGAKRSWAEYGIDFDKDIDVIARALHDLDWNNMTDAALDNLLKIVTDLQSKATAPTISFTKEKIYKIAQTPSVNSPKQKWDSFGATPHPDYDSVVKPTLSALWSGKLDMIQPSSLKEIIDFAKASKNNPTIAPFKPGEKFVFVNPKNKQEIQIEAIPDAADPKLVSQPSTGNFAFKNLSNPKSRQPILIQNRSQVQPFRDIAAPAQPTGTPASLSAKFKPGSNWSMKDNYGNDIIVQVMDVDDDTGQIQVQNTADRTQTGVVSAKQLKAIPKPVATSLAPGDKFGFKDNMGKMTEALVVEPPVGNKIKVILKGNFTPVDVDIRALIPMATNPKFMIGKEIEWTNPATGTAEKVKFKSVNDPANITITDASGADKPVPINQTKGLIASTRPSFNLKRYASTHR